MPEARELPESLGPLCSLQPVRVAAHHFESDMGSLAHRLTTILESRNRIGPGTSKPLGVDPAQGCDGAGDRGAGATEPPPSFSAPVSRMDHVHFAVTSASEMACGESHVVSVWVFPEPRHKDLAERALAEHGTDYQISSTGPAEFEYGSTLQLRLKVEGLEVTEPDRTVLWVRDLGKATYAIRIPGNARIGTHAGRVSVRFAGFEVAVLDFTLVVGAKTKRTWSAEPQVTRYRTGFASYASRDRAEVLARVQGLEKAGVDVFVDVKDLRSGDRYAERLFEAISRRDVLYLFWSKAASRSRWVEREWRYAYDRRGIDFIDPVPLVHPEQVPPPEELIDAVHFRDWVLAWTASPRPRLRRRSLLRRLLRK